MNGNSYINDPTYEQCEIECVSPKLVYPLIGKVINTSESEHVAEMFDVLSDPTRLRILHALSLSGELCVCDLSFLVEMSQSAVSHQLRNLRTAGVVSRRKKGRTAYYALEDQQVTELLRERINCQIKAK
ncbi:MAG: helix-turn-helix transcriptional regulator [SAR202 cluster bacterium]|nr:helix-turn-helix transcriptional regulator [SAR202 cluster bacterium]